MKYNREIIIELDINLVSARRIFLRTAKIIHRMAVFTAIFTIVFTPFGDLLNQYAYEHFPKSASEQIAKVVLKTQTTQATVNSHVFVFITYSSGSSGGNGTWTVPLDWNSASNSIEAIGGGGTAGDGNVARGGGGGGGGAYARINNLNLTPGRSITFSVGASGSNSPNANLSGGDGRNTHFNSSNMANCLGAGNLVCVGAEKGQGGGGSTSGTKVQSVGGPGGTTASSSGTVKYAGGKGGNGSTSDGGGGGGGAGGPHASDGTGRNGGVAANAGSGGGGGGGGSAAIGSNGAAIVGGNGGAGYGGGAGGVGGNNSGACGAGGSGQVGTAGTGAGGGGGKGNANTGCSGGNGAAGSVWASGWGPGGGGGGAGDNPDNQAGGQGGKYGAGGGAGGNCNTTQNCRGANGLIVLKYRPIAQQTHFQWFNDNYALNSKDNAASISAEDIKASASEGLVAGTIYRVRFQISHPSNKWGNFSFTNTNFRLEMTKAGASCASTSLATGWKWMTASASATERGTNMASAAFDIEDSTQFSHGAATSQLLATPVGATTFTAGFGLDTAPTSSYETIAENNFTEMEWALKPNSNAVGGASYCFRAGWIIEDGTNPDTVSSMAYSKIASASIYQPSTYTQNDYQWFYNINDITPVGAVAAENTAGDIVTTQPVRLRANLTVGGADLTTGLLVKLKYSTSATGPWTDVGAVDSSETWRYYNNPGVADQATLTSNKLGASDVSETYQESNPSITNPNGATTTQDIEYDFSLDPTRAVPGTTYYFRITKSDNTELTAYTTDPTINITAVSPPGGGGGGGGSSDPSGGGSQSGGGGPGGGGGGGSGGDGGSGGGNQQGGGGPGGGGGGGSPVLFDWWKWLFGGMGSIFSRESPG